MNNIELEQLKKDAARWQAYRNNPDWKDVALLLPMTPKGVDEAMDMFIENLPKT